MLADAIQVIAASAHKSLELAGDHGQDGEGLVGRFHRWVGDQFPFQRDLQRLAQEGKGEAGGKAESGLRVQAASRELQLQVRVCGPPSAEERKINAAAEDGLLVGRQIEDAKLPVRQSKPLTFGRRARRECKRPALPAEALGVLWLGRDYVDGECRQRT